ncbi:MAG: zinc finger domain-containing protein [Eggerthellaceae bacterium]
MNEKNPEIVQSYGERQGYAASLTEKQEYADTYRNRTTSARRHQEEHACWDEIKRKKAHERSTFFCKRCHHDHNRRDEKRKTEEYQGKAV